MFEHENRIESVFTDPGKICHQHKHNSVTGFAEVADQRAGLYETEQEIRKFHALFKYKINKENLPKILEELLKYKDFISVTK